MKKNDAIQITKITIKIGGKEVTVSMKEAKQLKEAMDEIFPAMVAPIQITYRNEPYYVPDYAYPNYWTFGAETTLGGNITRTDAPVDLVNTCSATLEIKPEGNLII